MWQHGVQQISDQCGLVVGRRVERHQGDASHVEIRVLHGLQEVCDARLEEWIDWLRLEMESVINGLQLPGRDRSWMEE